MASNNPMARPCADRLSGVLIALLLALTALTCKNQLSTQDLLDGDFLSKGKTPIDLLSPTENQQVTTANPTFSWSSKGVSLYTIQVATDANFSNIVLTKDVSEISYKVANADLSGVSSLTTSTYFWRVKVAKVANSLQSKTGSFLLIALPAGTSGYAGAIYVNGASTASVQVGSKEAPYKKIQTAIGAADALRNSVTGITLDVLVAQGTYSEEISLIPGISIRGGYEATNWTRNIAVYTTTIQATIDVAIRGGNTITVLHTNTTWIEGFTIQGLAAATSYGVYLSGSSPTIANCTITVGTASAGDSYGIYISSASPSISNTSITSGSISGSNSSYGIYNDSSSATIANSSITGGTASGTTSSHGIANIDSSPTISGNTITGGKSGYTSYGIRNTNSSPSISRNTISGGAATTNSFGVYNFSSSPNITNNIIISGVTLSGGTFGIYNTQTSAPAISGNTIIVSAAGTSNGYGIRMDGSKPTIRNNTLYLTGKSSTRVGIGETVAGDNPVELKNNAFFDIGTGGSFYVYLDVDTGTGQCWGGGASAGGNCVNIIDMESDLNGEPAQTASGNISLNPLFVNFPNKVDVTQDGGDAGTGYSGTTTTLEVTNCTDYVVNEYLEYDRDGVARQISTCSTATGSGIVTFTPALASASVATREIRLWGINNTNLTIDLHLKASSPCDVREGGLDLSALFTTDRDGATRTASLTCGPANSGAQGWSIGAYEF